MLLMATYIKPAAPCLSFFGSRKAAVVSKAKACNLSTPNSTNPKAEPPLSHSSTPTNMNTHRRSGNYKPPSWPFEYIQSINNDFVGEKYTMRFNELKEEMRKKLKVDDADGEKLEKLELIDNLQRLGLSYHFKEEIFQILRSIHQQQILQQKGRNVVSGEYSLLYATSLKFKLLREYGFDISQDTLNNFKIEIGNIKESLGKDIKGLLQLYEASFFATETENTLKFATKVTKSELKNYLENYEYSEENVTTTLVRHALELPSHWMMLRLETRWYLNVYEKMPNANPLLLELAKLDFNIVQATHQQELKDVSRWWKNTCLAEKLPFSRDRLVECFFWAVGMVLFKPQQGHCRVNLAKINALVTALDDIYDIYGTYHELQLFTNAVERWDLKAMEQLPEYMKVMYLAMFNTINEIVYKVLKEQGINVLPYLIKPWTDLCKAYLREARWYFNGHKPTMQEYMDNAWISVAMPMILTHAFFLVTNPITKEELESLSKYPDIIRWSSTIVRFADDLGTSSDELKRGDVSKSIQCYMNETGASEEEAREHIQHLIKETWEMLNKARTENLLFSGMFVEIAKNTARTAQYMYLHGDGHGIQNSETKNSISKILFEHITVPNPFMSPNSSL